MSSIADIRRDYQLQSLLENDIQKNPIDQFSTWWNQAIESQIDEVNAMTLATVDANHKPSARIVLLKDFDENGFVFFTNYSSKKGLRTPSNSVISLTATSSTGVEATLLVGAFKTKLKIPASWFQIN
jgi:pyridoxamine 5'-phosphate oxidase